MTKKKIRILDLAKEHHHGFTKTKNYRVHQKIYRQYTVGKEIPFKEFLIHHSKSRHFGQKLAYWDSGEKLSTHNIQINK